ncbi:MAG TPA: Crp/Fnr family transcriptional regulator [Candidatus Polarisedimenticolia bacterium]|nr:Crp/Fnr family transcriptional regulator [Candidatus Polarisedimenticolia bacterium]
MPESVRRQLLSCYPVLRQLEQDLFTMVQKQAQPVQAGAGQPLFDEGSPCSHFPLLVDGVIRAMKRGPDGHEILLYRLHPGESCVITTVALLGETAYPAYAAAETNLTLYGVPRSLFLELILKSPPFRMFVFDFLSRRMAHLMALIDDVAFRRLDQRLASRLLLRPEPITVTHQMLADELGTTREVVSRTLETFQESGMLRLGRKKIEILNRDALGRVQRSEQP